MLHCHLRPFVPPVVLSCDHDADSRGTLCTFLSTKFEQNWTVCGWIITIYSNHFQHGRRLHLEFGQKWIFDPCRPQRPSFVASQQSWCRYFCLCPRYTPAMTVKMMATKSLFLRLVTVLTGRLLSSIPQLSTICQCTAELLWFNRC